MKTTLHTQRLTLIFLLLLCLTAGSLKAQNYGNDLLDKPRTFSVNPFRVLKVNSGIIVNLIPSEENKIVIYGDRYNGVIIKEKGATLKLKIRLSELVNFDQPYVDLYYSENLEGIKIHQGALVEALRPLKSEKLILKTHEGSEFSGEIMGTELISKVHTGSLITLSGKVDKHFLKIRTGGVCKAQDLITDQSNVAVFAGGTGKVYSENKVSARVSFGGYIHLYGSPKEINASRNFGGHIQGTRSSDKTHNKRRRSRTYRYSY